jgi:hypothetical protein
LTHWSIILFNVKYTFLISNIKFSDYTILNHRIIAASFEEKGSHNDKQVIPL